MSKQKGAGRQGQSGNVVFDLGEEAYRARSRSDMSGGRGPLAGTYRPGAFSAGYRPWYARGQGGSAWNLGQRFGIPERLDSNQTLTGALLGTLGNRLVVRVVPQVLGTSSRLAAEAVAFGVGLIPFLANRNSWTAGVALPGLVFLAGALSEVALDAVGLPRPVLAGIGESRRAIGAMEAALAARQKLAEMAQRVRPSVGVPHRAAAYANAG